MRLNHILTAEQIIKIPIKNSLRTIFLVILACHRLKRKVGKKLRLQAHSSPLCLSLLHTAALHSLEHLIEPDTQTTSGKMSKQTRMKMVCLMG